MPQLLLTDSTMPVSFCKAGIGCARAMAQFLGANVYMVEDVHEELERLAESLPALKSLLEDWPPNPIRELDLPLKVKVAAALKARRIPGAHQAEDRGETATISMPRSAGPTVRCSRWSPTTVTESNSRMTGGSSPIRHPGSSFEWSVRAPSRAPMGSAFGSDLPRGRLGRDSTQP
jgi:hypothetical protein